MQLVTRFELTMPDRPPTNALLIACLLCWTTALHAATPTADDLEGELPRIAPLEPDDALTSFQTLPGFRMELVAAEPLVYDPVALSFDENGRLFVIEMRDYAEPNPNPLGRVRLLEDTDGDGRFDKSTVYADDLSWPTAVIAYGGGVFVGAAPDILWIEDTDGDGRANRREVVFTGFRRSNVQGLLNSFRWGLDNRIHGATSTAGASVHRADDPQAAPIDLSGRDFSFDPRTLELRAESGGGQHGLSFDDWGRKFVCSNSSHMQMVMFDDRYLARNRALPAPMPRVNIAADGPQAEVFRISPVEPWRIARTRLRVTGKDSGRVEGGGTAAGYFTGATGATIYRGDAWPEQYRGQAFIGDVGSNIIHRKALEPEGVGLIARRVDPGREFVASTDIWFRPAQFANAPDGTLYVADVYREVIEHPDSIPPVIKQHLDLSEGRDRGRIYRIVVENHVQRRPPRLGDASTAELVETLEHRNGWHRDAACRLLYQQQDPAAPPLLSRLLAASTRPEARLHVLWALEGLDALTAEHVLRGLGDEHASVREQAIQLAENFATRSPAVEQMLLSMVSDAEPRVRYQLAFTLGELTTPKRITALAELARRDSDDRWMRLAMLSSLAGDAAQMFQILFQSPDYRAAAGGRQLLVELVRLTGIQHDPESVRTIVEMCINAESDNLELLAALLCPLDEGLRRQGATLEAALRSDQRDQVQQLIGDARETALQPQQEAARRIAAVQLLSLEEIAATGEVFRELLDPRQPVAVQQTALDVLGRLSDPEVADLLLDAWPRLGLSLRAQAAELLFSRTSWLLAFLAEVEQERIPLNEFDASRLKLLSQHQNVDVREAADRLAARRQLAGRTEVVEAYRSALTLDGEAKHGRALFKKHCSACHRAEGVGFEIGPNLATLRNRGAEFILLNVLDPNREVNPQFVNYLVLTTDGRTASGLLTAETATSVTLQRGENASDTILRSDIEQMRSTGLSLMPEGMEQQLDPQALADLIAYLLALE